MDAGQRHAQNPLINLGQRSSGRWSHTGGVINVCGSLGLQLYEINSFLFRILGQVALVPLQFFAGWLGHTQSATQRTKFSAPASSTVAVKIVLTGPTFGF